ncbi:hypothetical protein CBM2586_B130499 [Cupriavidus phytorum]|uniref:Uncharacterized protein n=1 Tax=Cupriavidus taiwanensis TaxID=164546 RepID=A0A375CJ44_9BURK|nr:hypothetical protein CBM2586_B130499 [Cupriavidus taiwanensis]
MTPISPLIRDWLLRRFRIATTEVAAEITAQGQLTIEHFDSSSPTMPSRDYQGSGTTERVRHAAQEIADVHAI